LPSEKILSINIDIDRYTLFYFDRVIQNPERRFQKPFILPPHHLGYKNKLHVKSVKAHTLSPNFKGLPVGPSLYPLGQEQRKLLSCPYTVL
jgi:hypothetical protein